MMSTVALRRGTPRTGASSEPPRSTLPSGDSTTGRVLLEFLSRHWEQESGSLRCQLARSSPSGGEDMGWIFRYSERGPERPSTVRRDRALALLRSWIAEGDVAYDSETRRLLILGMNEERQGERQFPE